MAKLAVVWKEEGRKPIEITVPDIGYAALEKRRLSITKIKETSVDTPVGQIVRTEFVPVYPTILDMIYGMFSDIIKTEANIADLVGSDSNLAQLYANVITAQEALTQATAQITKIELKESEEIGLSK